MGQDKGQGTILSPEMQNTLLEEKITCSSMATQPGKNHSVGVGTPTRSTQCSSVVEIGSEPWTRVRFTSSLRVEHVVART